MTETIGQRLKAAREAQKLTLEKAFEDTRIRIQYLEALEADDLSSVPSPVQARGYLRNYAQYLGLDFEELLDELRVLSGQTSAAEVVGPADNASNLQGSLPSPESTALEAGPATQTAEPVAVNVEDEPGLVEEAKALVSSPGESPDIPKGKPGRRKRAASQTEVTAAESLAKHDGLKKIQAKRLAFIEPEMIEEPVVTVEPVPDAEPVPEEAAAAQRETPPETDASDTLWQKWLNRFSSVLSARMRRPTLVQRESANLENAPETVPSAPEVFSGRDERQSPPDTRDLSFEQSSEIFKEIGAQLRERRELLSLHLDEVERNTHVKAHYLEALEKGAMDKLPSTVQTRGMLSNYATFLDMDVDALLLRFADALQARHREKNPQKPGRKPGQPIIANVPPIRTFMAGDIIFGVGIAVLLVGFAIWGVSRVVELQGQQDVQPTAPSISDVLLASPDPSQVRATATLQPVEAFPGLATVTIVVPTQDINVDVQVNLVAVERTYMRVVVDGEVAFEGRVVPGNAYPYQAETQIEVLVGSGAAIRTVYNGRDLGLMGTFGQVVNNIYTASDVITPTALPSPTATSTLPTTPTAFPTATLTSTGTPAPSNTPVP